MTNWIYLLLEAQANNGAGQIKITNLITDAGPVVKVVLLILLIMSVISWTIIFSKAFVLKRATKRSEKFLELYNASGNFGNLYSSTKHIGGPIAEVFRAGYTEILKLRRASSAAQSAESKTNSEVIVNELGVVELVERALKRTMASETAKLEGSLIFLATTGSAAPFIGLFGTVWGIMDSFHGIGKTGSASLAVVAPGISEALVATAIGLVAAIPAVVAYNHYVNKVNVLTGEMDNFSQEFLNIVERMGRRG